MTTTFIEDGIWSRLTKAAKACQRPADVAVAYFSEGAATRLPLPKGSRLVVDANEATVKAGLTCPADLLRLDKKGVRIFSVENLHAKVYVFGGQAFIGSANVSNNSADRLKEAMLQTTEREAVVAARAFVRSLGSDPLGPETLATLQKLYRRPKFMAEGGVRRRRKKAGKVTAEPPPLRLAQLCLDYDPEGSEAASEAGRRTAKSRLTRRVTHSLDEFRWHNRSMKRRQTVVQIVDRGRTGTFVSPPGRVINTKYWSNGRSSCTFVYLEVPNLRWVRLGRLAKRLGRGASKRLARTGLASGEFSDQLREIWRR